ncbi:MULTISPECIES: response regulator [Zhongshania]|jgi:CheY-like chemotaxis protein|uniref:CheY-like chemotaxis protein n=1 Tax=Zhongshania antarctica TaxID=641702 RepID=A0A840R5S8_9GAMM|nr:MULTISPECIES: response regulator [Zhongshania]MBB5188639.1 CheY-like chemotaxis protein [Zhongshania antarctica]
MTASVKLERVLYIEDEPDIRLVAEIALHQVGGLNVITCSSGEEGLSLINDFMPQLIILDVMMPGMDGPQILCKLRDMPEFKATPVVFITAKVQADEVEQFKRLGAADVISKPFNPMTLADDVRAIWAACDE